MITYREKADFLKNVMFPSMPEDLLIGIVEWIADHLEPDDVFTEKKLEAWAEENDYAKE